MLSLSSFSQTDTTRIPLPSKTARLVIKDLIKYDGCAQELTLTQEKISKLEGRDVQKDTIIGLLTEKDKNNQYIISQKDLQIGQYEHMTDDLTKEIKRQRFKSFLWKAGTFLGTITSGYLFIK